MKAVPSNTGHVPINGVDAGAQAGEIIDGLTAQLCAHQMTLRVVFELIDDGPGTPAQIAERMTDKDDDGLVWTTEQVDEGVAAGDPYSIFDYPGPLESGLVGIRR